VVSQPAPAPLSPLRAVSGALERSDRRTLYDDIRDEFRAQRLELTQFGNYVRSAARKVQYRGHVCDDPVAVQVGVDLEAVATRVLLQRRELPSR